MSGFDSWSERDIFLAKRSAEMETASVAHTNFTTSTRRSVPMHRDSSQISDLLNPVRGIRDAQLRAGIKPVDHHRHNKSALRHQSEANRERRLAEAQQVAAAAAAAEHKARLPVMRRSRASEGYFEATSSPGPELQTAVRSQRRTSEVHGSPKEEGIARHKSYGRVPTYLRERQVEMAQDFLDKQKAKEAALIPKGMRMMEDEERQEMLAALEANKAEIEGQIQALPLRVVTFSQIAWKEGLEQRFEEVLEAIALFSRPKVLVEDDRIPANS